MKIDDIKVDDVLVNVDGNGAGFYKVAKVNRVTVDVIGENGNKVRAYPHIFNRKVPAWWWPVRVQHHQRRPL